MSTAIEKATILVEALPYIKKFHGKTVVIKYGGNAMINEELKSAVINDLILLQLVGMHPVIVHGGGPEINDLLDRLQIEAHFVNGLRVTDEATMKVVEMVLIGKVNTDIVSHINKSGGRAIGLSGKDDNLLYCHPLAQEYDLGFVGEVEKVNSELLLSVMKDGYIPVVAPVGVGDGGQSYNVNADYAASKIAAALGAEKLVLLTNVKGLYAGNDDKENILSQISGEEAARMIAEGTIAGGMIPKVKCCLEALEGGVSSTHIIDGRQEHSILLELLTNEGIGTMVTP